MDIVTLLRNVFYLKIVLIVLLVLVNGSFEFQTLIYEYVWFEEI